MEKQSTSPELVAERRFQGEGRASVSCEKENSRQKATCLEQGGMGRGRECGSGGRGEAGRAGHRSQVTGHGASQARPRGCLWVLSSASALAP